jgi:hypothetical protein
VLWLLLTLNTWIPWACRYADAGIASVRAIATPVDLFVWDHSGNVRTLGLATLRAALEVLAPLPATTPLVVHVFSNGGGFVLEQLRLCMHELAAGTFNGTAVDAAAVHTLRTRLVGEIFDSAPCASCPSFHHGFCCVRVSNIEFLTVHGAK